MLRLWPKIQAGGGLTLGLALVSSFGPTLGIDIPFTLRLVAFFVGAAMILWPLLIYIFLLLSRASTMILTLGFSVGMSLVIGCGIALYLQAKPPIRTVAGPYFYFDVEINDPTVLTAENPGRIVNDGDIPFHNVDSWFSPSAAKRNPNGAEYWSLRPLKVVWTPLHKGSFWTGKSLPPGDYCVEYNSIFEGKSVGFVERLQIVPFDGKLIRVVDVWKDGVGSVYSSPRPAGFQDTPVEWPHP